MSSEPRGVCESAAAFATGQRSARENAEAAIEACEADQLGAFWHVLSERALTRADELDARRARGERLGALAGVPFGAKDCFHVTGVATCCGIGGDPVLPLPTRDAAAIDALESADAILVAKTSMDQLAWGMKGDPLGFDTIRNPADPTRMAGGSSGGSAAAVGSGALALTLGTDAGGSVRQPAGWCGVVGFKPRLGAISTTGCAPMAPSLDTIGTLTRNVGDQLLVFDVLCSEEPEAASESPTVGVVSAAFSDVDPVVTQACEDALRVWEQSGATLVELDLPWVRRGLGTIYAAELAASWTHLVDPTDARLLPTVRAGLEHGGAADAVAYLRAQQSLEAVREEALRAISTVDVVAGPTSPMVAPPLDDPDPTALAGRNTRVFNGLGWPALSVPVAAPGLPVGLQLAAGPSHARALLGHAHELTDLLGL